MRLTGRAIRIVALVAQPFAQLSLVLYQPHRRRHVEVVDVEYIGKEANRWEEQFYPARSTAPALFAGVWALDQLRLFWVAPIIGALIAGYVYHWLSADMPAQVDVSGR